jgi:hypothetical protein
VRRGLGLGFNHGGTPTDRLRGGVRPEHSKKPRRRCCTKGHVLTDCTKEISCQICEGEDNVAAKCPVKKKSETDGVHGWVCT